MTTTKVSRIIKASRKDIYRAFIDPTVLAKWRAPDGMTARVHEFDAQPGGRYRMSLTYTDGSGRGKTSSDTDTFEGRFVDLVPDEKIVEAVDFESDDPGFAGTMTMTTLLAEAVGGTEVTVLSENLPAGIRPEDNELGCRMSLRNLARLVE